MVIVSRILNWYVPFRLASRSYRLKVYRRALRRELRGTRTGRLILHHLARVMAENTQFHEEFAGLVGKDNYQKCFWESDLGYSWFQGTIQAQNKYFEFALGEIKTNNLQSVLDVGCGWGKFCSEVIKHGVADCKGIDISAEIISQAKKNFPQEAWAFEHKEVFQETRNYDLITLFGSTDYIPPAGFEKVLEHIISHSNKEIIIVNSLRGTPIEKAMVIDRAIEVKRYDDGYLHPINSLLEQLKGKYSFTFDIRKYGADSLMARILKS